MSQKVKERNFCPDCLAPSIYHLQTWLEDFSECLLPPRFLNFLPKKFGDFLEILLENIFVFGGIAKWVDDFSKSDIQPRSWIFTEEARIKGIPVQVLRGPFGCTNHFRMKIGERTIRFNGLPFAEENSIADDKKLTKEYLEKGNFPVAPGKAFWFWENKKAMEYGEKEAGFPLVVKPRSGSVSRHVTINIKTREDLKKAIQKAIIYSPTFMVEKFIPGNVYRATVVNGENVFCVRQEPARVVGDGILSIKKLIEKKNSDPQRGEADQKEFTLHKIILDETVEGLLKEKNYDFSSVPLEGEIIYLQKDSFLRLGGDLVEMTDKIHPDNADLFRQLAKFFNLRLTGIDFIAEDISQSWQNQQCAILELNSLPCIELHHFPSIGQPQNVAKALLRAILENYQ
ncbi:hypothetical protein HYV91_02795 [Candidatus Wolfebacteria bacterium]|nr:hypothetical protein [Candidatus Wolfebacteria bacterium]